MSGAGLKKTLQEGGRIFGTMISINRSPRWIPILDDVGASATGWPYGRLTGRGLVEKKC